MTATPQEASRAAFEAPKHTPGPWWVTDSGVRDSGGYICHTNPATHYPGQDERYEEEKAERAANAVLIAASPDLLAALQEAVALADKNCPVWNGQLDRTPECKASYDKCVAAIAKATGRPHQ